MSGAQFEDLRSLIAAVVDLDAGFSEDREFPLASKGNSVPEAAFAEIPVLLSGIIYYFDVAGTFPLPAIKLYIMVRHYGPDDLGVAQGVVN